MLKCSYDSSDMDFARSCQSNMQASKSPSTRKPDAIRHPARMPEPTRTPSPSHKYCSSTILSVSLSLSLSRAQNVNYRNHATPSMQTAKYNCRCPSLVIIRVGFWACCCACNRDPNEYSVYGVVIIQASRLHSVPKETTPKFKPTKQLG